MCGGDFHRQHKSQTNISNVQASGSIKESEEARMDVGHSKPCLTVRRSKKQTKKRNVDNVSMLKKENAQEEMQKKKYLKQEKRRHTTSKLPICCYPVRVRPQLLPLTATPTTGSNAESSTAMTKPTHPEDAEETLPQILAEGPSFQGGGKEWSFGGCSSSSPTTGPPKVARPC